MTGSGPPESGDAVEKPAPTARPENLSLNTPEFAKHKDLFVVKADKVQGADPKVTEMLHGMQLVDGDGKPVTTNPDAPVHLTINDGHINLDTDNYGSVKVTFPDKAIFTEGPNSTVDAGALTTQPDPVKEAEALKAIRSAPKLDLDYKYLPPPPEGGVRG
jgi:hypothetical protein